jgi:hypothetical protein
VSPDAQVRTVAAGEVAQLLDQDLHAGRAARNGCPGRL